MAQRTLVSHAPPIARLKRPTDRLSLFSVSGAAACTGLAALVILSPDVGSILTNGTAVMYDAMIWMAEICRFD